MPTFCFLLLLLLLLRPDPLVWVYRITVDEVLDESRIRVLIAPLVAPSPRSVLVHDTESWASERELLVSKKEFLKVASDDEDWMPAALEAVGGVQKEGLAAREELWSGFKEGQVFLTGQFSIDEDNGVARTIAAADEGPRQILRIDRLNDVKEQIKKLYADALVGRERHDSEANNER